MLRRSVACAALVTLTGALLAAAPAQAGFFDKLAAPESGAGGKGARSSAKVVKNEPGWWRGTWNSKKFPHHLALPYIATAVSTAEIERNGTRIRIDFSKPEDVAQLRKGDMVFLQPGYYTTLPTQAAEHLTFIGVEGQTQIGNGSNRITLPAKGTRFWDLRFRNFILQNEGGRSYLVNSRIDDWHQGHKWPTNPLPGTDIVSVFTNMGLYSGAPSVSIVSNLRFMQGNAVDRPYALFLSHGQRDFSDDGKFIDVEVSPEFLHGAAGSASAATLIRLQDRLGAALSGGEPFLTPTLADELSGVRKTLIDEAKAADRAGKLGARYATLQQDTVDETLRYLKWKTKWTPKADGGLLDPWLAKAAAELEAGNPVLALALVNRAMNGKGAADYAPALELRKRAGQAAGARYGCALAGNEVTLNVRAWAAKNMPLLNIVTPESACKITLFGSTMNQTTVKESVEASVVNTRLEAYDPMAAYKRMMAAAAAKEAEKAYMAGINASTERMADTARKMYDYRVRREGDFLVYGQGDFGGKASAGTLAAQAQAQSNAQAYAQAARAQGMAVREVKERVDTFFVNITATASASATIEKKGEPTRKLTPPDESITWSFGPCERKAFSDLAVHTSQGECITRGRGHGGSAGDHFARYYDNYVYPFLATFVAESMVPPVLVKVGEARKSTRPGTRLEAMLLAHFAGITPAGDAEVAALAEKVSGEKMSLQEFGDELGIN